MNRLVAKRATDPITNNEMLKNYFKTAIRSLYRDKSFVLVNLMGLSVGLAAAILLLSYVRYELSYDTSYSNAQNTYRLVMHTNNGDVDEQSVLVKMNIGPMLQKEFPQILSSTFLDNQGRTSFVHHHDLADINYVGADSNFFKTFNVPLLYGNPNLVLNETDNIVIDQKTAIKFFSKTNAVGETMIYKNIYGEKRRFLVTGIMQEIPTNMHFQADAVIAWNSSHRNDPITWEPSPAISQYILLKEGTDIRAIEKALPTIYRKYHFPKNKSLSFQHVPSIHLHSRIPNEAFANSDIRYIYIFLFVTFLLLAVASVNYINLATVRSFKRNKEIGMRKILGSSKTQLRLQFLGESLLFFISALPLAFLIAFLAWPTFSHLVNISVSPAYLFSWQIALMVVSITLLVALLSGAYPAFFTAVLRPLTALKDNQPKTTINFSIRKALLVLQFVISLGLIVATIVVNRQLNLLNNAQLGYNKNLLLVLNSGKYLHGSTAFKNELLKYSKIKAVTVSSWRVGEDLRAAVATTDTAQNTHAFYYVDFDIDPDFIKTMQLTMLEGQVPALHIKSEDKGTSPILLSRSAVQHFQLKNPINKVIDNGYISGIVTGIFDDFKGVSLKEKMPPMVLHPEPDVDLGWTYIRIAPGNVHKTLEYIQNTYKRMFPYQNHELSFMDDRLQQFYTSERRLAALFNIFVVIAISIVCVGLATLIALVVQQRTKEIGIRKVLGANTAHLIKLLTVDFIYLVLVAFLIACPLTWWAMNKWLEDYAHKITINWWIFVASGLSILLITLLTVGFQAVKAAIANPVDSLRNE